MQNPSEAAKSFQSKRSGNSAADKNYFKIRDYSS